MRAIIGLSILFGTMTASAVKARMPAEGFGAAARGGEGGWEDAGTPRLEVGTHELHLAAERAVLGMTAEKPLGFDFKWTDNVPADAEGIDFLDHGDTAPNARFNYRYLGPVQGERPGQ